MNLSPIVFTLYDADDQPFKEFKRSRVPWGLLKQAIGLAQEINLDAPSKDDMDKIATFLIDFYDGRVTLEEIDKYADSADVITVLESILARANAFAKANPTLPIPPKEA